MTRGCCRCRRLMKRTSQPSRGILLQRIPRLAPRRFRPGCPIYPGVLRPGIRLERIPPGLRDQGLLRRSLRRPERNDHAEPAARIPAPVVVLDHFRRGIGLQSNRTKIVAQQTADGKVALFLIAGNRTSEVGRSVGHGSELPFAELLGRRQVNVDEIRATAV
jgi:hypothetical protein